MINRKILCLPTWDYMRKPDFVGGKQQACNKGAVWSTPFFALKKVELLNLLQAKF